MWDRDLLLYCFEAETEMMKEKKIPEDVSGIWELVDHCYHKFSETNKFETAYDWVNRMIEQLGVYAEMLEKFYQINNLTEKNEVQTNEEIRNAREKRRRILRSAKERILEYKDNFQKKLSEIMNSRKWGEIFLLGDVVYLANCVAHTCLGYANATLREPARIVNQSKTESEYKNHIETFVKEVIHTLARYLSSKKALSPIASIDIGKRKEGFHGEYPHNYRGEEILMMGLCQPYTLTIAFLNGKDKDIKRFQELIKLVPIKTGIKRRCLNMLKDLKKTDLLQDVYGMSDVEKLLFIDIKKLEYIARRRGKKIRELIKRGRCQAVSLTEIMDYLTGDIYEVTDVLLRYFGEKFGEPTNMAKEIESYKEDYLSRYSVRVNVAAKQIKELKECIESDNGVSCYAQQLEEKLRTLEFYINSLTDNLEGLLLFSPDNGKGIGREAKKLRSELRSLKKDLKGLILKGENIESVKSHLMELTRYLERANERLSLINSTLKIEEEERGKISYVV